MSAMVLWMDFNAISTWLFQITTLTVNGKTKMSILSDVLTVFKIFCFMSFSNENQFSESSAVTCLGVCSVRVCVCVLEDNAYINFSVYSQAKRPQCFQTVFCTAWVLASTDQTQKVNVGLQKKKHLQRNWNVLFFCCLLIFLFASAQERGISLL